MALLNACGASCHPIGFVLVRKEWATEYIPVTFLRALKRFFLDEPYPIAKIVRSYCNG